MQAPLSLISNTAAVVSWKCNGRYGTEGREQTARDDAYWLRMWGWRISSSPLRCIVRSLTSSAGDLRVGAIAKLASWVRLLPYCMVQIVSDWRPVLAKNYCLEHGRPLRSAREKHMARVRVLRHPSRTRTSFLSFWVGIARE